MDKSKIGETLIRNVRAEIALAKHVLHERPLIFGNYKKRRITNGKSG